MDSITNSLEEAVDVIIASVNPKYIKSESTSKLLNGDWITQTIGDRAEKLEINVISSWAVLSEILGYADTKEELEVAYLDFVKSGHIIGQPEYEVFSKGGTTNRLYSVTFELAVVPDV